MPPAPTRFPVAGDVAALTLRDGRLCVLLVERKFEPFVGQLALPGGFVEPGEMIEVAARRELAEETGLTEVRGIFKQVGAYGLAHRDPRGDTLSVVYLAISAEFARLTAGDDAATADWYPVTEALAPGRLAFDHEQILRDVLARAAEVLGAGGSTVELDPSFVRDLLAALAAWAPSPI
ncbi:NUDIX domain-containing protein [Leucobacter sp. W1153]|uniref:NUDIX domain-containing protein n=1 Tax=unclassified Leucobacter TaxID=2621730 RepID=UPI003F356606